MTDDPLTLEKLRTDWNGVRLLRGKIQGVLLGSFAMGAPFAILIADAAHNLPFLQACAVLNDALQRLARERRFPYKGRDLGRLLPASIEASPPLPWIDFPLIKKAVKDRNALAHHAKILPRCDCWRYIDAIEAELVAWGIVLPSTDEAAP